MDDRLAATSSRLADDVSEKTNDNVPKVSEHFTPI